MAQPIFLVGWRRSGTTWLGSLISQNSNVASILGGVPGKGGGCVESYFFSHLSGKFGCLTKPSNLVHFIEVFGSSAFFDLSGLGKKFLYDQRPGSYEGLFRVVMDQVAQNKGTDWWLEKTPAHSFHLEQIHGYYPDAKFIAIERKIVGQIRSAVKLEQMLINKYGINKKLGRLPTIIKELVGYHVCMKHLKQFRENHKENILIITYEDLIASRRKVLEDVCKFLGFEFESSMMESIYQPASSFKTQKERHQELSGLEVQIIKWLNLILSFVPYVFYRMIFLAKRKREGNYFPEWIFSTQYERYNWDDLLDPERTRDLPEQK